MDGRRAEEEKMEDEEWLFSDLIEINRSMCLARQIDAEKWVIKIMNARRAS